MILERNTLRELVIPMYKIISFSLWGDDPIYLVGAIRNAALSLRLRRESVSLDIMISTSCSEAGEYLQKKPVQSPALSLFTISTFENLDKVSVVSLGTQEPI